MSFVVLDSEAVSALASPRERGVAARRAQAVLVEAERRNALIRVSAAVLLEVYRGGARDAAIDRIVGLPGRVVSVDRPIARLAGSLLSRRRLDSRYAVDALVVATAAILGPSLILTSDKGDLEALASALPHVRVVALDEARRP